MKKLFLGMFFILTTFCQADWDDTIQTIKEVYASSLFQQSLDQVQRTGREGVLAHDAVLNELRLQPCHDIMRQLITQELHDIWNYKYGVAETLWTEEHTLALTKTDLISQVLYHRPLNETTDQGFFTALYFSSPEPLEYSSIARLSRHFAIHQLNTAYLKNAKSSLTFTIATHPLERNEGGFLEEDNREFFINLNPTIEPAVALKRLAGVEILFRNLEDMSNYLEPIRQEASRLVENDITPFFRESELHNPSFLEFQILFTREILGIDETTEDSLRRLDFHILNTLQGHLIDIQPFSGTLNFNIGDRAIVSPCILWQPPLIENVQTSSPQLEFHGSYLPDSSSVPIPTVMSSIGSRLIH